MPRISKGLLIRGIHFVCHTDYNTIQSLLSLLGLPTHLVVSVAIFHPERQGLHWGACTCHMPCAPALPGLCSRLWLSSSVVGASPVVHTKRTRAWLVNLAAFACERDGASSCSAECGIQYSPGWLMQNTPAMRARRLSSRTQTRMLVVELRR
jgi:hypothetical protein